MDLRMACQVIIDTRGKGVANLSHPGIEPAVFFAGKAWNLESVSAAILVQRTTDVSPGLRYPSKRLDEVGLDAPIVVLRLRVSKTKDCSGIGGAKDVRHAIGVTVDRHRAR